MQPLVTTKLSAHARNMLFLTDPSRWQMWPFLAVVKRLPGQPEIFGVLFDAMGANDLPGYSATVFLTNLFVMPPHLDEFLALPKEVYDTRDELAAAGWSID